MRRTTALTAAAACAILLASVAPAKALRVAMPNRTPAQQAMTAEVIVVGKVVEIEKEMTKATSNPGVKDKVDYQVAVVKISEAIQGAKGLTTIRVGWMPTPRLGGPGAPDALQPAVQPAIQPIGRPPFRQPQASLTDGQEGCFFLSKHHDGDFYVMQSMGMPLDKKAADFDKQLDTVKKVMKTFAAPVEALKAADEKDRVLAAWMLIQKYRIQPVNQTGKPLKQTEISAEESKLILDIIAKVEWQKFDPTIGTSGQQMFGYLGVNPGQHGFNPPKFDPKNPDHAQNYAKTIYPEAVKKWLEENRDKYRIQRWVAAN
jgi:hypothetical protein